MKRLTKFIAFLTPYGVYSYFVMFAVLIACGFGFPMPEDVVLITGGILAARGVTDFWLTVLTCLVGVMIGDGVVYTIGRVLGRRVKRTWLFKRMLAGGKDARIQEIFERWGDKVIFMARFMPGLRMPIYISTGVYRVSAWKFFILDGLAAMISVPLWIYVGYVFGANLDTLERKVRRLQVGMYGIMATIVFVFLVFVVVKNRINRRLLDEAHEAHEKAHHETQKVFTTDV